MGFDEASLVLVACAGTGALLCLAVLVQWMSTGTLGMSTGTLGMSGIVLLGCGVLLLGVALGTINGWLAPRVEQPALEQFASRTSVDALRDELSSLSDIGATQVSAVERNQQRLEALQTELENLRGTAAEFSQLLSELEAQQAAQLSKSARQAELLTNLTGQLQELKSFSDTLEGIPSDIGVMAGIQSALLRWGIGVSRGMREKRGAVATLQMAEFERLRGRSESIKQRRGEPAKPGSKSD